MIQSPTQKSKLVAPWLLKLISVSSLATAVIGLALYWFKKYPPRRKISSNEENSSNSDHVPIATQSTNTWSNKLLTKVRKNKKKMTISLKNTVLWNPSPNVDEPIYAFQENTIQILTRLSYLYDIYVLVHVNTEEEKTNIQHMLENATSSDGLFVDGVDNRKIIFCSEEEGKIHIIRHIEPAIHVEGGWEKDDGEDIVQKLKPFVHKIIWIVTKKRRDSMTTDIKDRSKSLSGNIELSDLLTETSIAREVKD